MLNLLSYAAHKQTNQLINEQKRSHYPSNFDFSTTTCNYLWMYKCI